MDALTQRNVIIKKFDHLIRDDSNLVILEGVFDSINTVDDTSLIPEEHYQVVQERREKYHDGKTEGATWEEVKQHLKEKHGL